MFNIQIFQNSPPQLAYFYLDKMLTKIDSIGIVKLIYEQAPLIKNVREHQDVYILLFQNLCQNEKVTVEMRKKILELVKMDIKIYGSGAKHRVGSSIICGEKIQKIVGETIYNELLEKVKESFLNRK